MGYAGWMEHSFFFVAANAIEDTNPLAPRLSTFETPYSFGDRTKRNPTAGSARWSGVMAAHSSAGKTITGNVVFNVDFAANDIDIAFTNMVEQGGTSRMPDMRWTDVPLRAGTFDGNGLLGHFYGPGHEEVGGIFNRDGMTGAFGINRQ